MYNISVILSYQAHAPFHSLLQEPGAPNFPDRKRIESQLRLAHMLMYKMPFSMPTQAMREYIA